MKESEVESPKTSASAEKPARKPRLRRILKISAILAFLFVAAILSLPYLLSASFIRTRVEANLSAALGTQVRIEQYYFDWFRGVGLRGLDVANPDGFTVDEKLFSLRSFVGDVSFLSILRSAPEITGRIEGLELRLVQNADGTTNIGQLLRIESGTSESVSRPQSRNSSGSGGFDWSEIQVVPEGLEDLRLDLELVNSLIEIRHVENGVLERLENIEVRIGKEYGSTTVQLSFEADLHRPDKPNNPGRITTRASFNPLADNPVDTQLICNDIDLSRYRPILETILEPGQVEEFRGVVTGNWTARLSREGLLTSSGSLELENPHFKGRAFQGMNIRAQRWTIQPNLRIDLADPENPTFEFDAFVTDLGFARIRGLSREAATSILPGAALGLEFEADLDQLASFGGPVPAELRDSRCTMRGKLALPNVDLKNIDIDALLASVHVEVDTVANRLAYAMAELTAVESTIRLTDGVAVLTVGSKTRLNGGALALEARCDVTQLDEVPVSIHLELKGSEAKAEVVELLRYVVPLLSGLSEKAGLDFSGQLDLSLDLDGIALKRSDESLLQWLEHWRGKGRVGMHQATFTPASTFAQLFSLAAKKEQITIEDLDADFELKDGYVQTALIKFHSKGREYGLRGRTKMSGEIDYSIDASALLKGHKDGEKVLEYLPENTVTATLKGTVDAPRIGMPNLTELFTKAAENAAKKLAGDEAQKALDKVLDKNLDKKTKDQINDLLKGILGGKKKKK